MRPVRVATAWTTIDDPNGETRVFFGSQIFPRTALHLLGPWAQEVETCEHPDERCEGMPGGRWRCKACGYRGPAGAS